MTDRYAVVGNPIAHSRSPQIHAAFARATRQDIEYDRIEAPPGGFARAADEFRAAGGKGLNITLPFKADAFRYCTDVSGRAGAAGVVNTLLFGGQTYGDNTDGVGLVRDLSSHLGFDLRGSSILLLGAGGAAQGVIPELLGSGARGVTVANRTADRAKELAARFPGVAVCSFDELSRASDVVINATSAGLAGESPALPDAVWRGARLAYDMVYGRDTPFLAKARAAGVAAHDGLGMLVEQAAESFFLWRNVRPDTRSVLAAMRAA